MVYKYSHDGNFEDYASGKVLYGMRGVPNFPVRLIQEIFLRAVSFCPKSQGLTVYDCCCGGGYSLTVLGLLNPGRIGQIWASDIDTDMLQVAEKNLSLLTRSGMEGRLNQLRQLYERFHKHAHLEAIASARRLMDKLPEDVSVGLFQADVMAGLSLAGTPDVIITDVPYGNLVNWSGEAGDLGRFMASLMGVSGPETVIAVCMDKRQKLNPTGIQRLDRASVGKRKFEIYRAGIQS